MTIDKPSTHPLAEELHTLLALDLTALPPEEKKKHLQHLARLQEESLNTVQDMPIFNFNKILQYFIDDLYKDAYHFFFELLQNADDASHGQEAPFLHITVTEEEEEEDYHIDFLYSDRGFTLGDLFAITALGRSTKTQNKQGEEGTIGEKGIGFKSIFSLVDRVDIKSKDFGFYIQIPYDETSGKRDLPHIFLPKFRDDHWEGFGTPQTQLTLYIPKRHLNNDIKTKILDWLKNASGHGSSTYDSPLLFLKNIQNFEATFTLDGNETHYTVNLSKEPIQLPVSPTEESKDEPKGHLFYRSVGENQYICYKETIPFTGKEMKSRWDELEIADDAECYYPMEIAFPLLGSDEHLPHGKVYSYLPTNIAYNHLPIYLNVDVHLTASRGNINQNDFAESGWNKKVSNSVQPFLINAYLALVSTHQGQPEDPSHHEALKQVREHLYRYFETLSKGKYYLEINEAFRHLTHKTPIFLAVQPQFSPISPSQPTVFCTFFALSSLCYHTREKSNCISQEDYPSALDFLSTQTSETHYSASYQWNLFAKSTGVKTLTFKQLVTEAQGFASYWAQSTQEVETKKKTVLFLYSAFEKLFLSPQELEHLQMILVERPEKEHGFQICAKNQLPNIFFHDTHRENEHESANFIYQDKTKHPDTEGFFFGEMEQKFYVDLLRIKKYNLVSFFHLKTEELRQSPTKEALIRFIQATFPFYRTDQNPHKRGIGVEYFESTLEKDLCPYSLSKEDWDKRYDKPSDPLLAFRYGLTDQKTETLSLSELCTSEEDSKMFHYLCFLGLQTSALQVGANQFEKATFALFNQAFARNESGSPVHPLKLDPSTGTLVPSTGTINGYLQRFFLTECSDTLVFPSKFAEEIYHFLRDSFPQIPVCFKEEKNTPYSFSSFRYVLGEHGIPPEPISCGEDSIVFLKPSYFPVLFRSKSYKEDSRDALRSIGKSSFPESKDLVKKLHLLHTINEYFGSNLTYQNQTPFSQKDFFASYDTLKQDWAYQILGENYSFSTAEYTGFVPLQRYLPLDEKPDLNSFLQELGRERVSDEHYFFSFLENILLFSDAVSRPDSYDISVDLTQKNQDHTLTYSQNNQPTKVDYLLKIPTGRTPKSTLLARYIKIISHKPLDSDQKKRLEESLDEFQDKKTDTSAFGDQGTHHFPQGPSLAQHEKMLREYNAPSLHKHADMFRLLPNHYGIGSQLMEGYGDTCPLCGDKTHAGTKGMVYHPYQRGNSPQLPLYTCRSCATFLSTAEELDVIEWDSICEKFQYFYCADPRHPTHNGSMMTVTLRAKAFDGTVHSLPMKLSYANLLVMYKKHLEK